MRWILLVSVGWVVAGCLGAPASPSEGKESDGAGGERDIGQASGTAPGSAADVETEDAADSSGAPDAKPLDVVLAGQDRHEADAGDPSGDAGADRGAIPPGCEHLAPLFGTAVRPWTNPCQKCHDMTYSFGQPKLPGPPWWHPTDDVAVVSSLFNRGLVDASVPAASLFLLYPLAAQDGGLPHPGGDQIFAGTGAYDGFITFLEAASKCVAGP